MEAPRKNTLYKKRKLANKWPKFDFYLKLKILEFFSLKELKKISGVSKEFQALAQEITSNPNYKIKGYLTFKIPKKRPSYDLIEFLKKYKEMWEEGMFEKEMFDEEMMKQKRSDPEMFDEKILQISLIDFLLKNPNNINKIKDIFYIKYADYFFFLEKIINFLAENPNINKIENLKYLWMYDPYFFLEQMFCRCKFLANKIKYLDLSITEIFISTQVVLIKNTFPFLKNLEEINFKSCSYLNDEILQIIFKRCPKLKRITLLPGAAELKNLESDIRKNLEEIILGSEEDEDEITDENLLSFLQPCSNLKKLTLLNLRNVCLQKAIDYPVFTKLKEIKIGYCPIDEKNFLTFLDKHKETIEKIHLSEMTIVSLKTINKIDKLEKLKILIIDENQDENQIDIEPQILITNEDLLNFLNKYKDNIEKIQIWPLFRSFLEKVDKFPELNKLKKVGFLYDKDEKENLLKFLKKCPNLTNLTLRLNNDKNKYIEHSETKEKNLNKEQIKNLKEKLQEEKKKLQEEKKIELEIKTNPDYFFLD